MKILLDECVDQRFRHELTGHTVFTVPEAGWAGKKNGELLALASESYDVFITVDRNLYFQQNIAKLKLAVLVLVAPSNRLADLRSLGPQVLSELSIVKSGQVFFIPKQRN